MTSASLQIFGRKALPRRGGSWLSRTAAVVSIVGMAGAAAGGAFFAFPDMLERFSPQTSTDVTTSYELRIASLRSEVDRLTTRGFVDRQSVSNKVDLLLDQQAALSERYSKLQSVLDRARSTGLLVPSVPVPSPKPEFANETDAALAYTGAESRPPALRRLDAIADAAGDTSTMPELIRMIGESVDAANAAQAEGLSALTLRAHEKSAAIGSVLRTEGIGSVTMPARTDDAGEGGPYVPATARDRFDVGIAELVDALDVLEAVRAMSEALPLAAPVASNAVSSPFGVRSDPFLGRAALHTGIDFVAESGADVHATATGKVVFAGDNGAYGRMVEIAHGNGLTTRYAHLSSIAIAVGESVAKGETVGRVGSTGRSTGPHLHYELRRAGDAVDPSRFLRAGKRIAALG